MSKSNMYGDSILQWNVYVGCDFGCTYCRKSFQAQMRRQIHNCELCGNYVPHFHEERLNKKLPKTKGDEFIWVGSSGDISFISDDNMEKLLEKVKEYPDRTFFFQTKNPHWFQDWEFPKNVLLGITLESNIHYPEISSAPSPWKRITNFYFVEHPRKSITIEPILKFDYGSLWGWINDVKPERVYIGYDSKKCKLPEPPLKKVMSFISELKRITKVKEKLLREAWDEK